MRVSYNKSMFIVGMLSWWYGAGWRQRMTAVIRRIDATMDYFSIDLLLRTLFSPFRQISAGKVQGPLGIQLRAFFDRLISRVIGAGIRLTMIFVGAVAICLTLLGGIVSLIGWALVPLMPIIGALLTITGWMPW